MFKTFLSFFDRREQQTVKENDNTFYTGDHASGLYRDRFDYDRVTILSECLRAWRVSPIARRIVKLYTQFVIGEGFTIKCAHKATQKFLTDWWDHPLNNLSAQLPSWCDERTRSGNLFFLVTATPDGMSFIRGVPSELIKDIQTADNDIFQEQYYIPVLEGVSPWPAYDPNKPAFENPDNPVSFMLHYTANKPVGVVWGEPDLAPLLPWIGRYSTWLEDRVRLNHFRNAFMFTVQKIFKSATEKETFKNYINSNPPKHGSILVTEPDENWNVLSPKLDSSDASLDGMALKKMIALGAGIPLHYLAEPESSTRTTAEAAGTPTFRGIEQMQTEFIFMLRDIAQIAVRIRKEVDRRVNLQSEIEIGAPDITERDNASLSLAAARIEPVLADLYDRELIDETEVLRTTYRMAGEVYKPFKTKLKGKRRPLKPSNPISSISQPDPEIEPL